MSIEVKKEDSLDLNEYQDFHDEHDEVNSMDFGSSSSSSKAPLKSPERLRTSTTLQMPSLDEIMLVKDLNWRIALQRYKTTQELTNDSRIKISKLLIKNIYERKFQLDGNYDLKMTTQDFQYLADTLVSIFPTEVAETYFCRSAKGKSASGKLYSVFLNTRKEISDAGLLQVNRRNISKSEASESTKTDLATNLPALKTSKVPGAMKICCSSDFEDVPRITSMWESCFDHRQALLREKSTLDYFNMFPFLKESNGYELLVSDANQKHCNCESIDRLELVATRIFERIQRQFKGDCFPKNYLRNYQNSADSVVLSLVLLPYLFTVVNKRASSGAAKFTKQEMYNKFFPHFPSLTELNNYNDTQNFTEKPVQVCVVGDLNSHPFSIIRVFNTKYHFNSPREAMNVAFRIFLALNLEFPFEAGMMWFFLRKFAFQIDVEAGTKVHPQVETMINEFNLFIRNTKNL